MEFIDTQRVTYDGKPLYISYEFFDGDREGRVFNVFLDTSTGQDLISRIDDWNYSRVYGYLVIIPEKYCGVYINEFYIQHDKYPKDAAVLKGLGKFMLCTAMNILSKTYKIDTVCLTAQSHRRDYKFYDELKTWSGQKIATYITKNKWGVYYNKVIDGYCDEGQFKFKIGKRAHDLEKLGTFIDTYTISSTPNDFESSFKYELMQELIRLEEEERLVNYYKRYGFRKTSRQGLYKLRTQGVYMVTSLESVLSKCSPSKSKSTRTVTNLGRSSGRH